jgi:hypothetical protein
MPMGMKSPLKLPDNECTITMGQFNRSRDAEAVRVRAHWHKREALRLARRRQKEETNE